MSDFVEINEAWDKALRLAESLKSYILKKYENTDPKDREATNKLMNQYDKACELKRKAFGEVVHPDLNGSFLIFEHGLLLC